MNDIYDTSWVDNLVEVDFLIKEYLIFRGYHKTWDMFYKERRRDFEKNRNVGGYQVNAIVETLIGYIRNLKLMEYLDFWNTLNERILNKLPPQYRESIYHLDTSLKRYYLVCARRKGNIEAMNRFFNKFGDSLISRPDAHDWMKWFILPHIKHPEKHEEFESYFHKNWLLSVQISLKNFLSTALCRFPRPKILAFNILAQERKEFEKKIGKLKEKLNDADFIIRSLQQQLIVLSNSSNSNENDESNDLINKAISQYHMDSIHTNAHSNNNNKNKNKKNKHATNESLQINEKYFRGVSVENPSPVIRSSNEMSSKEIRDKNKLFKLPTWFQNRIKSEEKDAVIAVKLKESVSKENDNSVNIKLKAVICPRMPIACVAFSSDGHLIAYSTNEVIQIYSIESFTSDVIQPTLMHTLTQSSVVNILSWDVTNSDRIYCKNENNCIELWSVSSNLCIWSLSIENGINAFVHNKYNDTLIVSAGKYLYLYNSKCKLLFKNEAISCAINSICMNHNGKMIMAGGDDGFIRIFDVKNDDFCEITKWNAHSLSIESLHLCDDANTILSIDSSFIVKQWHLNDNANLCKNIEKFANSENEQSAILCVGSNDYFAVSQCDEYDDDDKYFVIIQRTDNNNKKQHKLIADGHSKPITNIDWNKESNMIATASLDGTLRLFQVRI